MWWFSDQVFFHFVVLPSLKSSEFSALSRERYSVWYTLVLRKPKSGIWHSSLLLRWHWQEPFTCVYKEMCHWLTTFLQQLLHTKEWSTHFDEQLFNTTTGHNPPLKTKGNQAPFPQKKKKVVRGSFINSLIFHCLNLPLKVFQQSKHIHLYSCFFLCHPLLPPKKVYLKD